jgi:hypothetical protein
MNNIETIVDEILSKDNQMDDIAYEMSVLSMQSNNDGNYVLSGLTSFIRNKYHEFYPDFNDWIDLADEIGFRV